MINNSLVPEAFEINELLNNKKRNKNESNIKFYHTIDIRL